MDIATETRAEGPTAITDAKKRYRAGVLKYRQMGYWEPDYVPKRTPTPSACSASPRRRASTRSRPPRRWRANLSTATWTVVWTDRLTACDSYRAKAFKVEPVPNNPGQYFAWVAYDLVLFEEGSIANMTACLIGNVFSFKPLKAARLEDIQHPGRVREDLPGPAHRARSSSASGSTSSAVRCWARPPSRSSVCRAATTAA